MSVQNEEKYRATVQELQAQIDRASARSLPHLLTAVVKACVKNGIYKEQKIHNVVKTLEKNFGVKV